MNQSVSCLSHKHEDLSVAPVDPHEKLAWQCAAPAAPALGADRDRQGPGSSCPASLAETVRDPISKYKIVQRDQGKTCNTALWPSHIGTRV